MSEIVTMTIGITFYMATGQGMACGDVFTDTMGPSVSMPIEWNQSGAVSCGDIAHMTLASGHKITATVRDFGCMLHYPVGKSLGGDGAVPYGPDIARVAR